MTPSCSPLAGLGYAGIFAVAPLAFADVEAMVIVAIATLVTVGYGIRAVVSCRWQDDQPVDLEGRV